MEKISDVDSVNKSFLLNEIVGVIISFFLTLVLFVILGLCLSKTDLSENIIKPAILIVSGISILVGSSFGTRNQENGGIIRGGVIGFLYITILYLISSIMLKNFSLNVYSLLMFVVSSICGAVGGIIGVNLK